MVKKNGGLMGLDMEKTIISQMNHGNTSEKHLFFNFEYDIPKYFTGSCYVDGAICYFLNGKKHRENGTAYERDGYKAWWLNGQRHRVDGPAVEHVDGHKEWFVYGKYHRENGPAIEHPNGNKYWYLNGKLHREDGPAIEYKNGNIFWLLHAKQYGINNDFTNKSWIHFQKYLLF
jgi:hypothetical protein